MELKILSLKKLLECVGTGKKKSEKKQKQKQKVRFTNHNVVKLKAIFVISRTNDKRYLKCHKTTKKTQRVTLCLSLPLLWFQAFSLTQQLREATKKRNNLHWHFEAQIPVCYFLLQKVALAMKVCWESLEVSLTSKAI